MTTYPDMRFGDTSPGPTVALVDRDGVRANLTGATVVLHTETADDDIAVTVVDDAQGEVEVPRDDSLAPGVGMKKSTFRVVYKVTFSNGEKQTFPEGDPDVLPVWRALD